MNRFHKSLFAFCLGAACLPVLAQAPCPAGARLNEGQLATLLTGRTVCATLGNDRWQEWHGAGGALWDYKRGPNHPVDPSEQVGNWAISGNGNNAVVNYTYGSSRYSYAVCSTGTADTYDFRPAPSGSLITGARFRPASGSAVACP